MVALLRSFATKQVQKAVRDHLMMRTGGFTHLYNAARYAVTKLLRVPEIEQFLASNTAEPTIILITDGLTTNPVLTYVRRMFRAFRRRLSFGEFGVARGRELSPVFTVGLGGPYRLATSQRGKTLM